MRDPGRRDSRYLRARQEIQELPRDLPETIDAGAVAIYLWDDPAARADAARTTD